MKSIMECDECNGTGILECSNCYGSGRCSCINCEAEHECGYCHGEGEYDCEECNGAGRVILFSLNNEESEEIFCECGRVAVSLIEGNTVCSLCEAIWALESIKTKEG